MTREDRMYIYSDLHKEVWGCRPLSHTVQWVESMSDTKFTEHFDGLVASLEEKLNDS